MRGRKEIPPAPSGPFSLPQAARIAGVPYQLVDYWARYGLLTPSIRDSEGRGTWRQLSFADLVALKVAATLYRQGFGTRRLRRVMEQLPEGEKLVHPLAQHRLVVYGEDVLHVEIVSGERRAWSLLKRPGQGVFGFVFNLASLTKELREQVALVARGAQAATA